jgi:hypothetical protein
MSSHDPILLEGRIRRLESRVRTLEALLIGDINGTVLMLRRLAELAGSNGATMLTAKDLRLVADEMSGLALRSPDEVG